LSSLYLVAGETIEILADKRKISASEYYSLTKQALTTEDGQHEYSFHNEIFIWKKYMEEEDIKVSSVFKKSMTLKND